MILRANDNVSIAWLAKGISPDTISKATIPTEYISAAFVCAWRPSISGATYPKTPLEARFVGYRLNVLRGPNRRWTACLLSTRMFPLCISRWTIPPPSGSLWRVHTSLIIMFKKEILSLKLNSTKFERIYWRKSSILARTITIKYWFFSSNRQGEIQS